MTQIATDEIIVNKEPVVLDDLQSSTPIEKINNRVEEYKKTKNWFVLVENNLGEKEIFDLDNFKDEIGKGIKNATINSDNLLEGYFIGEDNIWACEKTTVKEFALNNYKLRNLYDPIWNNALAGLKWGVYIGIGLKVLDTVILLGATDISLVIFFFITIGVIFIPRIGIVGVIVASIAITYLTGMNFFTMALSAGLVGALLGCLPGMFFGGIYGLVNRGEWRRAHDATPEGFSAILKGIILPLVGSLAVILSYFYIINPWLVSLIE